MCDLSISGHSLPPSLFVEEVSCSSGWPPTSYMAEDVLEFPILPPITLSAGYIHVLPHPLYVMLGAESQHLACYESTSPMGAPFLASLCLLIYEHGVWTLRAASKALARAAVQWFYQHTQLSQAACPRRGHWRQMLMTRVLHGVEKPES